MIFKATKTLMMLLYRFSIIPDSQFNVIQHNNMIIWANKAVKPPHVIGGGRCVRPCPRVGNIQGCDTVKISGPKGNPWDAIAIHASGVGSNFSIGLYSF